MKNLIVLALVLVSTQVVAESYEERTEKINRQSEAAYRKIDDDFQRGLDRIETESYQRKQLRLQEKQLRTEQEIADQLRYRNGGFVPSYQ